MDSLAPTHYRQVRTGTRFQLAALKHFARSNVSCILCAFLARPSGLYLVLNARNEVVPALTPISLVVMRPHSSNRIVLFFGAGASAWAGYKTFLNFPGMFWASGNEPAKLELTAKERGILDKVKIHLAKKHLSPTLDSYLAAIHEFKEFTDSSVSHTILRERFLTSSTQWATTLELRHLLMTVRDRVCRLTAMHYREPIAESAKHRIEEIYELFEALMDQSENKLILFTTNYDLLPEYLFSHHKYFAAHRGPYKAPSFDFQNGFPSFADKKFEVSDDVDKRAKFVEAPPDDPPGNNGSRILWCHRLHGCVAWLREGLKESRIYFDVRKPENVEHFADKLCVSYPGHEERYGWMPHANAFRCLAYSVVTAGTLVFVGFSFRDAEVIAVIGRSLHEADNAGRPLPRIVIIDPQLTLGEVRDRIEECLSRVAGPCIDWKKVDLKLLSELFPTAGLADRIVS